MSDYTISSAYSCRTVKNGKTESFAQGTVIVLYSGSAAATGTLIDLTEGSAISSTDELVKYHQYLIPSDNTGFKATSLSVVFVNE